MLTYFTISKKSHEAQGINTKFDSVYIYIFSVSILTYLLVYWFVTLFISQQKKKEELGKNKRESYLTPFSFFFPCVLLMLKTGIVFLSSLVKSPCYNIIFSSMKHSSAPESISADKKNKS